MNAIEIAKGILLAEAIPAICILAAVFIFIIAKNVIVAIIKLIYDMRNKSKRGDNDG